MNINWVYSILQFLTFKGENWPIFQLTVACFHVAMTSTAITFQSLFLVGTSVVIKKLSASLVDEFPTLSRCAEVVVFEISIASLEAFWTPFHVCRHVFLLSFSISVDEFMISFLWALKHAPRPEMVYFAQRIPYFLSYHRSWLPIQ